MKIEFLHELSKESILNLSQYILLKILFNRHAKNMKLSIHYLILVINLFYYFIKDRK